MVLFHSGSDVRQLQGRQEINTIETNANGSSHGVLYVFVSRAPMKHRDDLVGVVFVGGTRTTSHILWRKRSSHAILLKGPEGGPGRG